VTDRRDDCPFSLTHYREILESARSGGYRFAGFDSPPGSGDLILRHDVDLSLDAAIRMAEVEADVEAWSTWFLMTRSVFYNLLSEEGERAIARLKELGGRVAHHAVWPHVDLDERFERIVAWHNPDQRYQTEPIEGAVNAMALPWYVPSHFRSDSNQSWDRNGVPGVCPHGELARSEIDWLHLNTHPEIWVYEGETMQQTMASFLASEREARVEQLRADRIALREPHGPDRTG
jgi:hypothetical protein